MFSKQVGDCWTGWRKEGLPLPLPVHHCLSIEALPHTFRSRQKFWWIWTTLWKKNWNAKGGRVGGSNQGTLYQSLFALWPGGRGVGGMECHKNFNIFVWNSILWGLRTDPKKMFESNFILGFERYLPNWWRVPLSRWRISGITAHPLFILPLLSSKNFAPNQSAYSRQTAPGTNSSDSFNLHMGVGDLVNISTCPHFLKETWICARPLVKTSPRWILSPQLGRSSGLCTLERSPWIRKVMIGWMQKGSHLRWK